jgi:hypothetical protein
LVRHDSPALSILGIVEYRVSAEIVGHPLRCSAMETEFSP